MVRSFFADNPLLAAIAVTAAVAVVVLLLGAGVLRLFGRRRRASAVPARVDLPDPVPAWDYAEPAPVETPVAWAPEPAPPPEPLPQRPRRAGFRFATVALAFLLGVVAGAVGLAVSSRHVATAVASLVAMVQPALHDAQPDPRAADALPPGAGGDGEPGPADVGARLAAFADRLKANLPRAAGPELSLTRVDLNGSRLSLGYAVARVMAPEETQAFDAYILRTAKSLFCDQESREIRSLSEAGAVFDMEYVDPAGSTVTRLTVEPGFCA